MFYYVAIVILNFLVMLNLFQHLVFLHVQDWDSETSSEWQSVHLQY